MYNHWIVYEDPPVRHGGFRPTMPPKTKLTRAQGIARENTARIEYMARTGQTVRLL